MSRYIVWTESKEVTADMRVVFFFSRACAYKNVFMNAALVLLIIFFELQFTDACCPCQI